MEEKKRLNIMIGADAIAALDELTTPRKRGELISYLILEELERERGEVGRLVADVVAWGDALERKGVI